MTRQHAAEERSKRKSRRRGCRVSTHQADAKVSSSSSIVKLGSFLEHVRDLVVGSKIVRHLFEDSRPSWRRNDRQYLIPECCWILGLRPNRNGYRYVYRVFMSELKWEQRKQLFDGEVTENILLEKNLLFHRTILAVVCYKQKLAVTLIVLSRPSF